MQVCEGIVLSGKFYFSLITLRILFAIVETKHGVIVETIEWGLPVL